MAANEEQVEIEFNYIPGFGSLADFIASDGDRSTAIYKRFDRLAARDLLYYQSELAELQAIQDEYDIQGAKDVEDPGQPESWKYVREPARDWARWKYGAAGSNLAGPIGRNTAEARHIAERRERRLRVAMDIRKTLKDYREALIQESTLLSMRQPSEQSIGALSNYFHIRTTSFEANPSGRATYPTLNGASSHLYPRDMDSSRIRFSDYVSLSPQPESDLLTHCLRTYCSRLFRIKPFLIQSHNQGVGISHLPRHQVVHYSITIPSPRFEL